MAHFAELDETNVVKRVIVINNDALDGQDEELSGINFCKTLFGGNWLQTSYNGNFRKQFAGIGYIYNQTLDMFIKPKCHDEAVLNELGDWDCENEAHNG